MIGRPCVQGETEAAVEIRFQATVGIADKRQLLHGGFPASVAARGLAGPWPATEGVRRALGSLKWLGRYALVIRARKGPNTADHAFLSATRQITSRSGVFGAC